MIPNKRRRAMTLIIVLAVMSLAAGIITGLVYNVGLIHAQHRNQRMQTMARYAAESAAAWSVEHAGDRTNLPLDSQLEISLEPLLSAAVTGAVKVGCIENQSQAQTVCDLSIRLQQSQKVVRRSVTILLAPSVSPP